MTVFRETKGMSISANTNVVILMYASSCKYASSAPAELAARTDLGPAEPVMVDEPLASTTLRHGAGAGRWSSGAAG